MALSYPSFESGPDGPILKMHYNRGVKMGLKIALDLASKPTKKELLSEAKTMGLTISQKDSYSSILQVILKSLMDGEIDD